MNITQESMIYELKFLETKELEPILKKLKSESDKIINRISNINVGDKVYITDIWDDHFECIVRSKNEKSLVVIEPGAFGKENDEKEIKIFITEQEFKDKRR